MLKIFTVLFSLIPNLLPGQACRLHAISFVAVCPSQDSFSSHGHLSPTGPGNGLLHTFSTVRTPPSQGLLQSVMYS